jgi:hypothetical protein
MKKITRWLLALAAPAVLGAGAPDGLEPLPAFVRTEGEHEACNVSGTVSSMRDGDVPDLAAFLSSLAGEESYDATGKKTLAAESGASSRARARRLIGRGR